jgi:hypothetical protein
VLHMKISVRPVEHESEKQELLGILQTNLPALPHERRFSWLYRANPDGQAWSWFLFQDSPAQVVGVTSVFPRAMWVGDEIKVCGQVGDFAVSASHRSLGPALLLQRATFEPVDRGQIAFCYDCPPHAAGMSIFRRLGMRPNCTVHRYAFPLRVDAQLRRRLGSASVVAAASGNLLLRLHRGICLRRKSPELEISEHLGAFGEEFSQLDAAVKRRNAIRGRRSAAHLNWRYREDPLQQYDVFTARRKGELVAFLVFQKAADVVTVVDFFGTASYETVSPLVAALTERYQATHQSVDIFLSEGSELTSYFLKMNFRWRSQAAQVVAYAKHQTEVAGFLKQNSNWDFRQVEIRA